MEKIISYLKILSLVIYLITGVSLAAEPVRVLVFTAPFGSGHNTAANRVKDVIINHYQAQGIEVEVIVKNTLDFAPKWWTDVALKQFSVFQSHAPIIYTAAFENYLAKANKVENAGEMKLFKQLRIDTKKMDAFIATEGFKDASGKPVPPTVVFSTWPGSTEALINLRNNHKSQYHELSKVIPLAHVQTDNATHDRYFHLFAQSVRGDKGADVVYVPSREVYDAYLQLGYKNIVFTGMPLRLKGEFLPSMEQREKDKHSSRSELGIPETNKTIMIEAGKNGGTNYAVIIASLVKFSQGEPLNIIAACGENEAYIKKLKILEQGARRGTAEFDMLLKEMKELYQPKTIRKFLKLGRGIFGLEATMTKAEVVDFIERGLPRNVKVVAKGYGPLEPLRSAADIVLTKPGGLSTAELGADGRPMIILQEYASGEALPNGPLFEKKKLAIINKDISLVGAQVHETLSDQSLLKDMYNAANDFRRDFKLDRVLPFVETAVEQQARNITYRVSESKSMEITKDRQEESLPFGKMKCGSVFAL